MNAENSITSTKESKKHFLICVDKENLVLKLGTVASAFSQAL